MRVLASVVGREGLSEIDRLFLDFGARFEQELVRQPAARTLDESMEVGWRLLRMLPNAELHRLSDRQIADHIDTTGDA
jgi:V/A-type H+-transporting ATPase subunit B